MTKEMEELREELRMNISYIMMSVITGSFVTAFLLPDIELPQERLEILYD